MASSPVQYLFQRSNSNFYPAAIASYRLVACRGLITSRWKGMASLHACADAAVQHLTWASPVSVPPVNSATVSLRQCAAFGRPSRRYPCCPTVRAAALPPVAAAVCHSSVAEALPELGMTKYGAEQEAACRAVRLAARLCQVQGATSACSQNIYIFVDGMHHQQ